MKYFIKFVVINGGFLWLMYKAFTTEYPSIFSVLVIIFTIIFMFIAVLLSLGVANFSNFPEEEKKQFLLSLIEGNGVKYKQLINKIYDVITTAVFFYFGWWLVGAMYLIHFLAVNYVDHFTNFAIGVINAEKNR